MNSLADRSWPVLRKLFGGHTRIYQLTRGVVGHKLPGSPPFLLLDHVGAKSGTHRVAPLLYLREGEDYVIVASKGGFPKHPAWFHNLKANPDTTIQVGSKKLPVRAREATDEERPHLWDEAVRVYPGYRGYQERTERQIPLVVLEPRG